MSYLGLRLVSFLVVDFFVLRFAAVLAFFFLVVAFFLTAVVFLAFAAFFAGCFFLVEVLAAFLVGFAAGFFFVVAVAFAVFFLGIISSDFDFALADFEELGLLSSFSFLAGFSTFLLGRLGSRSLQPGSISRSSYEC